MGGFGKQSEGLARPEDVEEQLTQEELEKYIEEK